MTILTDDLAVDPDKIRHGEITAQHVTETTASIEREHHHATATVRRRLEMVTAVHASHAHARWNDQPTTLCGKTVAYDSPSMLFARVVRPHPSERDCSRCRRAAEEIRLAELDRPCLWCGETVVFPRTPVRSVRCGCGVRYPSEVLVETDVVEWERARARDGYLVERDGETLIVTRLA